MSWSEVKGGQIQPETWTMALLVAGLLEMQLASQTCFAEITADAESSLAEEL